MEGAFHDENPQFTFDRLIESYPVVSASCLPLSTLCRGFRGADSIQIGQSGEKAFKRLLSAVGHGIANNQPIENLDVSYEGVVQLFSELPRSFTHTGRRNRLVEMAASDIMPILRGRTFWFRRLAKHNQEILRKRIHSNPKDGVKFLEQICLCADGMLVSLMLGFPGPDWTYEKTDAINNWILSNCIQDYAGFTRLVKKTRKAIRKWYLDSNDSNIILNPKMTRLYPFIRQINRSERTKVNAYRIACLTQTRAWGLGNSTMTRESVEKFLQITSIPCQRTWDTACLRTALFGCLPRDQSFQVQRAWKRSKLVVCSSACIECSQAAGGKASALADICNRSEYVNETDLETGQVLDKVLTSDQGGGNFMFHQVCSLIRTEKRENFMKVNLHAVREPAKCRTITASSIVHAEFLQPLGHFLLEILKYVPEARSGLSAARHLWNFFNDDQAKEFIESNARHRLYALCYDLETSTDYGNWLLGQDILDLVNECYHIPTWYFHTCCELLFSPRIIIRDGKEIGRTCRGWLMGDPVTKFLLTACQLVAVRTASGFGRIRASIVGDDMISISNSITALKSQLQCIRNLDLKLSEEDTFLSTDFVHFCEEFGYIPRSIHQLPKVCAKTSRLEYLCYIDYPRVRIIINVTKDREDFSSTPGGKMTIMGKEIGYAQHHFMYAGLQLASFIQDVCIGLGHDNTGMAYLPIAIGGYGKRAPFHSMSGVISYYRSWKSGTKIELINTIIHHLYYHQPIDNIDAVQLFKKHLQWERFNQNVKSLELPSYSQDYQITNGDSPQLELEMALMNASHGSLISEAELKATYLQALAFDMVVHGIRPSFDDIPRVTIESAGLGRSTFDPQLWTNFFEAFLYTRRVYDKPTSKNYYSWEVVDRIHKTSSHVSIRPDSELPPHDRGTRELILEGDLGDEEISQMTGWLRNDILRLRYLYRHYFDTDFPDDMDTDKLIEHGISRLRVDRPTSVIVVTADGALAERCNYLAHQSGLIGAWAIDPVTYLFRRDAFDRKVSTIPGEHLLYLDTGNITAFKLKFKNAQGHQVHTMLPITRQNEGLMRVTESVRFEEQSFRTRDSFIFNPLETIGYQAAKRRRRGVGSFRH